MFSGPGMGISEFFFPGVFFVRMGQKEEEKKKNKVGKRVGGWGLRFWRGCGMWKRKGEGGV